MTHEPNHRDATPPPGEHGLRKVPLGVLDAPRFAAWCIVLGVVVRVAWILLMLAHDVHPVSDSAWYYARAASIAAGDGYAIDGRPTAYWPVGYPAFLGGLFAVTGVSRLAAMLANAALWGVSAYLALCLARIMLRSERAARLVVLMMALHPNSIAYASLLLSEPLALCLLLAGTLLLVRVPDAAGGLWRTAVTGLVFGVGGLVKPQLLLVPVLLLAVGAVRGTARLRWTRGLLVYASAAVVLLPWTLRNHAIFEAHGILANNDGINLYIGNNPDANGTYQLDDATEARYRVGTDEHEWNARARSLALAYIRKHPGDALAMLPRKLWYYLRSDVEGFKMNAMGLAAKEDRVPRRFVAAEAAAQCWWVLLAAFTMAAVPGAIGRIRRRDTPELRGAAALFLYLTAIPIIFFGDPRFHVPAVPWMMMFAALFLERIVSNQRLERS